MLTDSGMLNWLYIPGIICALLCYTILFMVVEFSFVCWLESYTLGLNLQNWSLWYGHLMLLLSCYRILLGSHPFLHRFEVNEWLVTLAVTFDHVWLVDLCLVWWTHLNLQLFSSLAFTSCWSLSLCCMCA